MLFQHNFHKKMFNLEYSCGDFSFQECVLLEWTGMCYTCNAVNVAAEL